MNPNAYKKFFSDAKKLNLPSADKERVRERLVAFMASMPVVPMVSDGADLAHIQERSNLSFAELFTWKKLMPALIILTLAIFAGGGASFAAEQSLPGDLLYPIKIEINEKVKAAFAANPKAKTELEISFVNSRLDEAEKLASRGALKADVAARLGASARVHAEKAGAEVKKIESSGDSRAALELSSNLETPLKVHARILEKMSEKAAVSGDAKAESVIGLAASVKETGNTASRARADAEATVSAEVKAKADTKGSAEGSLKAAEKKYAEVKAFIDAKSSDLSAEARGSVEAQLKLAADAIAQGKTSMSTDNFNDAFVKFHESMRLSQEAKLLVKAGDEHKIDVLTPDTKLQLESKVESEAKLEVKEEKKEEQKEEKAERKESESTTVDLKGAADAAIDASAKAEGSGKRIINLDLNY